MKKHKLFLPILILAIALLAMAVCAVASNIALKPTITEHEFPFSITYELDGVTETVDAVCAVTYAGNGGYVKTTTRQYDEKYISQRENIGSAFEIFVGDECSITLFTRIYPDYLMGDPEYDYFDDTVYEPILSYSNWATGETIEGLELPEQGAKIISWELPEPIENSFEFSHIAHMSSADVFPFLLIAILAMIAMMIFVKRDKTVPMKPIDKISLVLNIAVAVVCIPIVSAYGLLMDINGSEAAFSHQMGYLAPAFLVLALAASLGLRRRGYHKSGLIVQFAGPVYFGLHLLISAISFWAA